MGDRLRRRICCRTEDVKPKFELPAGNSRILAKIWPGFVNMEKRMEKEIPFILDHGPKTSPKIFDACLGSGATSIGLKRYGIKHVISNEIDGDMIRAALTQADHNYVNLEINSYDWAGGFPALMHGQFDVVTCLGNSLTCVLNPEEHLNIIRHFSKLLNSNGILMIDERNYPRMLNGEFHHSGEYVYCGADRVACRPIQASDSLVVMEYRDIHTDEKAYLELYPFEKGEMLKILNEAGFYNIKIYGDYMGKFSYDAVEFITYVARK